MEVKVVGGHGGVAQGFEATSFLIDGTLLIDAGSVAGSLGLEQQCKIENILLSHSHLDHIKDLAFLCDNCFGMKEYRPFEVYALKVTKEAILKHLFNDSIWPDFSKIPQPVKGTAVIHFNKIISQKRLQVGGYDIYPVMVNHQVDTLGFIIEKQNVSVLFTLDTMATDKIWQIAKEYSNLKAIFTEVSFPNHLQAVATASYHHTPKTLEEELTKMPKDIPIFLSHLKPNFQDQLIKEINAIGNSRLQILDVDGQTFYF